MRAIGRAMACLGVAFASLLTVDVPRSPAATLTPTVVLGWSPGAGRDVAPATPLTVSFNRPMDRLSVQRAWQLVPAVSGRFGWDGATLRFTPSHLLSPGTYYHLTIATGARGADDIPLAALFRVTFATGDRLRVVSISPANRTRGVPLNGLLAVTFNHPMVALAGLDAPVQNPPGWHVSISPAVMGRGSWLGTSTWVFRPNGQFAPSTDYTIRLASTARDAWGESLGRTVRWSFGTVTPAIVDRVPSAGAQFIDPRTAIRITFNQAMDHASVRQALTVRSGSATIAGSLTWQGATALFHPARTLDSATSYIVTVSSAARAANGRATLARTVRWRFHVAPPPRLISTDPRPNGATPGSSFGAWSGIQLHFSTPMSKASLDAHLTISPAVPQFSTSLWGPDQDKTWVYAIAGNFDPSAHYTVSLSPGVHDQFGRPLPSSLTLPFRTGRITPAVSLLTNPGAPGIAISSGRVAVAPIQLLNVPRVTVRLVRTTLAAFDQVQGQGQPAGTLVRRWIAQFSHPLNQLQTRTISLAGKDGAPLTPALYWLSVQAPGDIPGLPSDAPAPLATELVLVSNVSVTLTADQSRVLVWVNGARSGKPLSGVKVRLVDQHGQTVTAGSTNADGLHLFRHGNRDYPAALIDDGTHYGLAEYFWQGESISEPWNYQPNLFSNEQYTPTPNGTNVYTDRAVYRPGQRVHFRAVLWRDADGVYYRYGPRVVRVQANDDENKQIFRATMRLDRFGTVQGSFRLSPHMPTGPVWVTVRLGRSIAAGTQVNVAEYRKPEFLTGVAAGQPDFVRGRQPTATVAVRYVFGAPVVHQHVAWTAYAQPLFAPPPGWDQYTFFDWESLWQTIDQTPGTALGTEVAHGSGETDGGGHLAVTLPSDLATRTDERIAIEATTTDDSRQAVSGRTSLSVYRSALAIGLAASQVTPAGKPATVRIAAVRHDGTALGGQTLTVTIERRTYHTQLARASNGALIWETTHQDTPLSTQSITTNAKGEAQMTFTPATGGEYRIVVAGKDDAGNPASGALSIYASAAGESDWGVRSDTSVAVTPDKSTYQVGETAHLLVAAPFDHASALITIERGTIRRYWTKTLASNSAVINVPITLDDIPNIYVVVTLYRGWRNSSPPDWRQGTVELHVRVDPRKLHIHLAQNGYRHQPGGTVTYTLTTTDAHGRLVSAELSLALVDTAVLALETEVTPGIVQSFYGEQPLGVTTASDGTLSIDHLQIDRSVVTAPGGGTGLGAGYSSGFTNGIAPPRAAPAAGGGGGSPAVATVRSHFADTAYWSGALSTNRSGHATIRIRLPDNTTTWQLTARGVTAGQQVGQAELKTLASRDIVVRPVTPRFLSQGDALRIGAVVNNTLSRPVPLTVSMKATGLDSHATPRVLTVPARGERLVLWPVGVRVVSRATLTLRAVPAMGGVGGDAIRIHLPVYPPLTDETVATAGQVYGVTRQLIVVPRNAVSRPGALTVQVSASLTAGAGAAFASLRQQPFESNDDVADRVLAAAALRSLPSSIAGLRRSSYGHLPLVIAAGVQKLLDDQLGDGGWPWFNGPIEQSDPTITADAVQALNRSGERSRLVLRAIVRGQNYLVGRSSHDPHLLSVLAQSGRAPKRQVDSLYRNTVEFGHLDAAPLADLGMALEAVHDSAHASSIVSSLESRAVVSASGAHWESLAADPWSASAISTTTEVLADLVALRPHDPLVPAAARWLMLARRGPDWDCPHDSAQAIAALAAYARAAREGSADYRYRIAVDRHSSIAGQYAGNHQTPSATLQVPIAHLPRNHAGTVDIARSLPDGSFGTGPLYYVARLHYFLPANAIAARDEGIGVARQYLNLAGQPISRIAAGKPFQVQLTIHTDGTLLFLDIEDPIPAGVEPIDQTLKTSQLGLFKTPTFNFRSPVQDLSWYLFHRDLRDDRVSLYAYYLPPGTYRYSYLVRASVPGRYGVPPTHAAETFFPEVFGRSAGRFFTVTQ